MNKTSCTILILFAITAAVCLVGCSVGDWFGDFADIIDLIDFIGGDDDPEPETTPTPQPTPTGGYPPDYTPAVYTPVPTATPTAAPTPTASPTPAFDMLFDGFALANLCNVELSDNDTTATGSGDTWYIEYVLPSPLPAGFLAFDVTGLAESSDASKSTLVSMWDRAIGYDYTAADATIFELRKYGNLADAAKTNSMKVKIKVNGAWTESGYAQIDWQPSALYAFRVEWGSGNVRVYLDDALLLSETYADPLTLTEHAIRIGANPYPRPAPPDLMISNVRIGTLGNG